MARDSRIALDDMIVAIDRIAEAAIVSLKLTRLSP